MQIAVGVHTSKDREKVSTGYTDCFFSLQKARSSPPTPSRFLFHSSRSPSREHCPHARETFPSISLSYPFSAACPKPTFDCVNRFPAHIPLSPTTSHQPSPLPQTLTKTMEKLQVEDAYYKQPRHYNDQQYYQQQGYQSQNASYTPPTHQQNTSYYPPSPNRPTYDAQPDYFPMERTTTNGPPPSPSRYQPYQAQPPPIYDAYLAPSTSAYPKTPTSPTYPYPSSPTTPVHHTTSHTTPQYHDLPLRTPSPPPPHMHRLSVHRAVAASHRFSWRPYVHIFLGLALGLLGFLLYTHSQTLLADSVSQTGCPQQCQNCYRTFPYPTASSQCGTSIMTNCAAICGTDGTASAQWRLGAFALMAVGFFIALAKWVGACFCCCWKECCTTGEASMCCYIW